MTSATSRSDASSLHRFTPERVLHLAWLVAGLLAIAVAGCGDDDGPGPTPAPGRDTSRILFVAGSAREAEIYTVRPDGSELTRLTNNSSIDHSPVFDREGRRVVFLSDRDRQWPPDMFMDDVFVMGADGSNPRNLTNTPERQNHEPTISPDAATVVFWLHAREDGTVVDSDIYRVGVDGSGLTNLTGPNTAEDTGPVFSPDGRRIVFVRRELGSQADLYAMNTDGTGVSRLTTEERDDDGPAFAPDGGTIVYQCGVEICAIDAGGGHQRQLTRSPLLAGGNPAQADSQPRVSPDGSRIAFVRGFWDAEGDIFARHDVVVMNADGSGQTNLTNSRESDHTPRFGPDGRIAFVSITPDDAVIFVIGVDGSGLARVAEGDLADWR